MKKFNRLYQIILQDLQNQKIITNKNLIFIPLATKSITQQFGYALTTYSDMYDNVILIVSNITKQKKQNQQLSLSNLEKIIKILNYFKDEQQKPVQKIISQIQNNENITFSELNSKISNIISKTANENFKNQLKKTILNIRQNIFKNVQNKDIIKDNQLQLDQYIKKYKLDNVIVKLSTKQSPVDDIIQFINTKCKKCTITINMKNSKSLQKYFVKQNQNIFKQDLKFS